MKTVRIFSYVVALFLVFGLAIRATPESRVENVIDVIDGDTIIVGKNEKVRLLGVDTPELHHPQKPVQCYAKEAKDFVISRVMGKTVKLTFEGIRKDSYGRTLAWVWYGDNFRHLLNRDIIANGYGFSYRKYPTSRTDEFNKLEAMARETQKGLWHPTACGNNQGASETSSNINNPPKQGFCASRDSDIYHPCSCPSVAKIKPENLIYFETEEEAKASGRRRCKCR